MSGEERSASGLTDISLLLVWFVVTLAPLTLTALSLSGWSTIGFNPPEISVRSAALFSFLIDLMVAGWLVLKSGGWSDSPFTSIMVAIPTFAILLGESAPRIFMYIGMVVAFSAICFALNSELGFSGTGNQKDRRKLNLSNWLLSSIMLALTAWIGLFGTKT